MMMLSPLQPPATFDSSFTHWRGLSGGSLSLVLAKAIANSPQACLIITANNQQVWQLTQELAFFLRDCDPAAELLPFPDWETLPYDQFSPHQDLVSERLTTLYKLSTVAKPVVVVSIATLLQRLPPTHFLMGHSLLLRTGQTLAMGAFRQSLARAGYQSVNQVFEHGEYALRGSIIDLFPMGSATPVRIDLFDDEIESIRLFDPQTQRSGDKLDRIDLLPAHEFPLTDDSIVTFRQAWREKFAGNPAQCPIYQAVSQGIAPPGIEYYLPLFFTETAHLLDYLPTECSIFRLPQVTTQADTFWREVQQLYARHNIDARRPLLPPGQVFWLPDDIFAQLKQRQQIQLHTDGKTEEKNQVFAVRPPPDLPVEHRLSQPLQALLDFLQQGVQRVLFCVESAGRREVLLKLLACANIRPEVIPDWHTFEQGAMSVAITEGALTQGMLLTDPAWAVIVENQLFGEQVIQQRRRKNKAIDSDAVIRNLTELKIGAPVVHLAYGVGRYQGLQTLTINEQSTEFLVLYYANDDKVYVPVTSLHLIGRYTGADDEHAPLHRLGSEQWEKAKRKARQKVRDVAAQLLDIYAKRAAQEGFAFNPPDEQYALFASQFPFSETDEQAQAIEQVLKDMIATQPMDRLICGDVGFGKTEVAMRAAFLAVQSHKQVAVLVPTTLLAEQHYQNFLDRFAEFPLNIELLSRFRSIKEQRAIVERLADGKVDIVIGTHKLIQKDIQFSQLGLIVIDEEHRFGVRQKEHLKALTPNVDILSLTATPIPRTLNMAMSGMRDISLITTPPAKRLAVKTFRHIKRDSIVREAILREVMRGGQVFYLHNEVETIAYTTQVLTELLPEASIHFAHGQMRERELEHIMTDFYHQRFNVLVCTTIIENGIDIPTANTIIIERADKFGLAQLHQLRGRVGRSHHQAYAYLLVPDEKAISKDAIKRLDALLSLSDLGIGFTLASHDLEIRGAGELLSDEQSGHIYEVGYSLFMEMLNKAVAALKSGRQPELEQPLEHGVEVELDMPVIIPEDYLADVHLRLTMYKRIANTTDNAQLQELQVEMIDRFGLLPESVTQLFRVTELKLLAGRLGIEKINGNDEQCDIVFTEQPIINTAKLIELVQQQPKRYRFIGNQKVSIAQPTDNGMARVQWIEDFLLQLVD
jgi:transcription-repair coupling factor (superfamily II helicase)